MSISWDVKLIVLDIARREVSVQATRVDSAYPANPKVYSISTALIVTAQQKGQVLDCIWDMHQAAMAREALITTYITPLEAQAKLNLEARE